MNIRHKLELHDMIKEFGSIRVLDHVSFNVHSGEIHALCGENGAGKSTLIKILCGIWPYEAYEGKIILNDQECRFRNPGEAIQHGIATIHQELSLVPELTVAENIFLGREPIKGMFLDHQKMTEEAQALMEKLHIDIPCDSLVSKLGIGHQQMVEIAKALSQRFKFLILDEPTSSLSRVETEALFSVLKKLKEQGIGIIYISHHLNEVLSLSDRVTVLRDGKSVATTSTKELNEAKLIAQMVGRQLQDVFPRRSRSSQNDEGRVTTEFAMRMKAGRLCVKNLSVADRVQDVSFTVAPGEILGIAGLLGSGRTELLEAIYGIPERKLSGEILIDDQKTTPNPQNSVLHGIALVTEDRKQTGLIIDQSILTNSTLPSLPRFSANQWINHKKEAQESQEACSSVRVKMTSPSTEVGSLSGGNQQKVVLAKWLMTSPKILLLDEPTRGVDIGAKAEIYQLIRKLADQGLAIVLVSSELMELRGLADRILVLSDGRPQGEFDPQKTSEEELMTAMTSAFSSSLH